MKKREKEDLFRETHVESTCPDCGMSKDEWSGNQGIGYRQGHETYCCQGCVEGTQCSCAGQQSV